MALQFAVLVLRVLDLLDEVGLLHAAHALDAALAQDLLQLLDAQLGVICVGVGLDRCSINKRLSAIATPPERAAKS